MNAISVMLRFIRVSLRRSTSNIDLIAMTPILHICLLGKVSFVVDILNLRTTSSGFKKRRKRRRRGSNVTRLPDLRIEIGLFSCSFTKSSSRKKSIGNNHNACSPAGHDNHKQPTHPAIRFSVFLQRRSADRFTLRKWIIFMVHEFFLHFLLFAKQLLLISQ